MPEQPNRANAASNQMNGDLKQTLGNIKEYIPGMDGKELIADGETQKAKGDAEYKSAQAADRMHATKEDATGTIKEKVGGLFSDKQKAEGQAKQAEGEYYKEKSKH